MQYAAPAEYAAPIPAAALRRRRVGGRDLTPCGRRRRVLDVERDVAGDVEIQPAVAVVVAKGAARRPAVDRNARADGHVGESAIAQVSEQPVGTEVGDVEIGGAVVVDVADADALAPSLVGHARRGGHVAERAVAVVAEERRARRAGGARLQRRAVDQIDVEQAVAVEVPQRHARARGLDDVVLLGAAGHVPEACKPDSSGDVGESHIGRRVGRGRRNLASGWDGLLRQAEGAEPAPASIQRRDPGVVRSCHRRPLTGRRAVARPS